MRNASISRLLRFAAFATVEALVGCAGSEARPSALSPTTIGDVPGSSLATPLGEKKVGPYVWVWKKQTISRSGYLSEVRVECPKTYVALGGGYNATHGSATVVSSFPNHPAYDGWTIAAYAGNSFPGTVTAYVSCAPSK